MLTQIQTVEVMGTGRSGVASRLKTSRKYKYVASEKVCV